MQALVRLLAPTFLGGLGGCAASAPVEAPPANSFLVRDVRLFDGERVHARTHVLVADGRIVAVGRAALHVPAAETVDGAGKTVLPGLIDSHVHVFPGAQA